MASLRVPEVTAPIQDSERLRKAFEDLLLHTFILSNGMRELNKWSNLFLGRLMSEASLVFSVWDHNLVICVACGGLVSSYRYDKEVVDPEAAMLEAARLNEAINKKQLDHDDVFWILSTRNVFQLRATFAYYKQLYGNPLEQDIKTVEKEIWNSIWGLGTDEDSLTRAIVTRAEIDLSKVEVEYAAMYKSSLEDDTSGDTSGDYRRFLMTLLGK
ncbi:annexin D3-like [Prosopis cineraria]|uniref:annexin D3-like n=1 Tax=Prosopis cineraria TaxID=364024 RepID=UPI00240EBEA4|nr:annexin D3-like [Prosopis cineraria]